MSSDYLQLDPLLDEYLQYLSLEKGLSKNTILSYQSDLQKFFSYLLKEQIFDINKINSSHIVSWLISLKNEGESVKSTVRRISTLRGFFEYLLKNGYILENPIKNLEIPKLTKKLPDVYSVSQIEELISKVDVSTPVGLRDKAMLEVCYATGLRVSELVSLKLENIDLNLGYIRVLGKGNSERVVPLNEVCLFYLILYLTNGRPLLLGNKTSYYLFINKNGKPITRQRFWQIIKKYSQLAGLPKNFSPHKIRHSFATHLIEGGLNLRYVQMLLGHKNINTTQIYTHVNTSYLKDIHKKYHPRG